MGQDKTRRTRADVPIRVTTLDAETDWKSGESFYRCVEETTADLSEGGAFIRSLEPLAAGRRILVEIDLPGEARIELHAQVAWTQRELRSLEATAKPIEHPGYGIQFAQANLPGLARLRRCLADARIEGAGISPLPSTLPGSGFPEEELRARENAGQTLPSQSLASTRSKDTSSSTRTPTQVDG